MAVDIPVSVQGRPVGRPQWLELAAQVERSGFDSLYVADHPGVTASPFVALAAAAAVTERIRLGTCVVNTGVWEPLALSSEVASLDVVSDGRAVLGVGAGHTPAEWNMRGLTRPAPGHRVARMQEVTDAVRALLAGETVSADGDHVTLVEARLSEPRPLQQAIPLLVGGNGSKLLSYAAATADIVGVGGLGRTLADGHTHEVDWGTAALDRTFELIASTAGDSGRTPEIEALVQHVEITADAEAAAAAIAERIAGAVPSDLLAAPYVWIGTVEEIADRLRDHRRRWGVTRYVVRQDAIEPARRVLDALRT